MRVDYIDNKDCKQGMSEIEDGAIQLIVTSPPYYNAREYSQWETVADYMQEMKEIFKECFRVLGNHHYIVVNVGDVVSQVSKIKNSMQKLPLGAMFTMMLTEIGFEFVDDYIWDKGEPQTKRHLGNPPYPYYQYPVNAYEHILIFAKHVLDKTRIACPVCNSMQVSSNGLTGTGVYSWECKNPDCPEKSEKGRGKRFSARSIMMQDGQRDENYIDDEFIKKWHRDIVRISPVVKINSKGENVVGHTAPYPEDIPEMAIRYFSCVGDIVLDPFTGSGTSCAVAKRYNRHYIGFELDSEYARLARERVDNELFIFTVV